MIDLDINSESYVFLLDGGTLYRAVSLGGTSTDVAENMRPGILYVLPKDNDDDGTELRPACKLTELFNPEQIE